MTALSNYAENKILDHLLGSTAWTMPTQLYCKLHTANPGEDCATAGATETTRKAADFAGSAAGTAVSSADIEWTDVSTTETYAHFSLWDHATAGNPIMYGAFASSIGMTAGDNFTIEAGDLSATAA